MFDADKIIKESIVELGNEAGLVVVAPLENELALTELGLDSLSLAVLVSVLEEKLEIDPFENVTTDDYPETLGQFVAFYELD